MDMIGDSALAESAGQQDVELPDEGRLLLRSEYLRQVDRRAQADPEFLHTLSVAETALDNWDWSALQSASWVALEMYPTYAPARMMYARALMEQNDLLWAEINYRSALAEGGDPAEIRPMLQLVARRSAGGATAFERRVKSVLRGFSDSMVARRWSGLDVPPLEAPPTLEDVNCLSRILWHDSWMSDVECLYAIRTCRTVRELACHMIDDERFRRKNRELLEMAAARS
jgi:hypothetical protein